MTLQVDSASRIDLAGYYPLYSLALAADVEDGVHVFTSASPHSHNPGASPPVIEHVAIGLHDRRDFSPLQAVERPIRSVTAHSGHDGRLYLLWAEEEGYYPNPHPIRLYVNEWTATGWSGPERVSDPNARPGIHDRGEMDFILGEQGSIETCWIDWREQHFWGSLFSAGEGDFPKVYCAVRSEGEWGTATRIQRRGRFWVHLLSAVKDKARTTHLFWEENRRPNSRKGYSAVFHSGRIGERWSEPARIADNRGYDDMPANVHRVAAAIGPADSILVAWIWSRWLSESQEEHVLEVRSYVAGRWSEGTTVLSHHAKDVGWVSGPGGTTGILFQEYPEDRDGHSAPSGHGLLFMPIESLCTESKVLIAPNTVPGLFDATVTRDRTTHLAYVSVDAEGATGLKYRQGKALTDAVKVKGFSDPGTAK